jgi:hypothetical protein
MVPQHVRFCHSRNPVQPSMYASVIVSLLDVAAAVAGPSRISGAGAQA